MDLVLSGGRHTRCYEIIDHCAIHLSEDELVLGFVNQRDILPRTPQVHRHSRPPQLEGRADRGGMPQQKSLVERLG